MSDCGSTSAFSTWLSARPQAWCDGVEVVAMDGFTASKTPTSKELPQATALMDRFHVLTWAAMR